MCQYIAGREGSIKIVRTPDAAFDAIADFPFAPHHDDISDARDDSTLRIHYIDDGPSDAPVVLIMHGEPT